MNKRELLEKVAEANGTSAAETDRIVSAVLDEIGAALEAGDSVALAGFGSFEVRERSARTGRNPQTGEEIEIAASKAPAFKPATALKRRVNGS